MRGTFAPIAETYSEELRSLILSMLHLDPNKRPHINQIMAQPIVVNALLNLHTEMGKLPCTRVHRPIATPAFNRQQRGNKTTRDLTSKPHSCVYCWGNGVLTPMKLPLPTSDTQVTQVSTGRNEKAAVTKNGRLFIWEVSCAA